MDVDIASKRDKAISDMHRALANTPTIGLPIWIGGILITPVLIGVSIYLFAWALVATVIAIITLLARMVATPFKAIYMWADATLIAFWYLAGIAKKMSEKK